METNKFTFIDLFSGIGGFRMALENNGGECLHFSEISKDAIEAYCKNSSEPIEKNLGDITKIKELPKLERKITLNKESIKNKSLSLEEIKEGCKIILEVLDEY